MPGGVVVNCMRLMAVLLLWVSAAMLAPTALAQVGGGSLRRSDVTDFDHQIRLLRQEVARLQARDMGPAYDSLKARLDSVEVTRQRMLAPVQMPSEEAMTVPLVPATAFDRLEEYHDDDALFLALFGIAAGAALGLFGSYVTLPAGTAPPNRAFWMLVGTLVVISLVFGFQSYQTRKRAERVRSAIIAVPAQEVTKGRDVVTSGAHGQTPGR